MTRDTLKMARNLYDKMYDKIGKKRIIFGGTFVCVVLLWKMRQIYIRRKLRKLGYLPCDWSSDLMQAYNVLNFGSCISAIELVSADSMDYETTFKDLLRECVKTFINFRSKLEYKYGKWYYKELNEYKNDSFDVDTFCQYIELNIDGTDIKDNNDDYMNEIILNNTIQYCNNNHIWDVEWMDDKWKNVPNWNTIYFHYKKHNKAVIIYRVNHALGDGMFLAGMLSYLHYKKFSNKKLEEVFKFKPINPPLWYYISKYLDLPFAFLRSLKALIAIPDIRSCIKGKYKRKHNLCLTPGIKINEFKKVARYYNGTVNDLFMTLMCNSIKKYIKYKNGNSNIKTINALGVRMARYGDLLQEFKLFGKYGTNANGIRLSLLKLPIKNATLKNVQRHFKNLKYNFDDYFQNLLVKTTYNIGIGKELLLTNSADITTLAMSNYIASREPLPLKNNDNVKLLYGIAQPGSIGLCYTLASYNDSIRIGILTDEGSINEPNKLLECFMDEFNQYSQIVNGI